MGSINKSFNRLIGEEELPLLIFWDTTPNGVYFPLYFTYNTSPYVSATELVPVTITELLPNCSVPEVLVILKPVSINESVTGEIVEATHSFEYKKFLLIG